MPNRIDLTNKKFGKLTAIKDVGRAKDGPRLWECRCECGTKTTVAVGNLTSGGTKTCGCSRVGCHSLPEGEASFNALFSHYKRDAKKRGYEFGLTKDQFREITNQECAYCGSPPMQESWANKHVNGSYKFNGIDRIDNSKGYVESNCVPCCGCCNHMKGTLTQKEFSDQIKRISKRIDQWQI